MSADPKDPISIESASGEDPEVLAALAFSTPPIATPAADPVRARLLARATADAAARGQAGLAAPAAAATSSAGPVDPSVRSITSSTRSSRGPRGAWWIAGLTSLAAAASLLLVLRAQSERAALRSTVASLEQSRVQAQQRLDSLALALSEREQQLASVTGPDVAVVELASTQSLPPAGRMFWDRATARWTFVANNLPQLAPGRTYTLWLVTADTQIPAGNFTPDANGMAVVRATYDLPRTALAAVAVTEEPEGGVPKPTGDIFLVGAAPSAGTR